ncbi:MAG TPA: hypothetical protein VLD16_16030 [Gaiellaceae bacterium]|nr:hypothetical protein [Gaiellaceae bacterium]
MDALTRSSSARAPNHAARASVVLALLGVALPIVAYAAANQLQKVSLVQATTASCGSVVLGGAAVLLARRGLRNVERTLGRAGGEGSARVGRLLGVIALCTGLAAAIALGVYSVLNVIG